MPPAPEARTPIATLTFEEGSPLRLKFEFASGDEVRDVVFGDPRSIEQAWQRAGHYLKQLVSKSPKQPRSARELQDALSIMLNAGDQLGIRLTDEDSEHYGEVQNAFQRSWPTWEYPSRDDIPVVQLVGHNTNYPLELLPVFSNRITSPLNNDGELAAATQRFLGFSAVIRRVAPGVSSMPELLRNGQKLPIQFFRFLDPDRRSRKQSDTSGFKQEQEFMASLSEVLTVDGPWPISPVTAEQVRQRLVEALFDPSSRLGTTTGPPAELAHFACHCETEGPIDDDYELRLSDERGEPLRVTLGQIRSGYVRLQGTRQSGPRAPVILNACGSSVVNPWSGLNFQRWFIKNQHRAFIGTQAAIPDDAAADFAERFYRFLLGGYTFGEAIVLARRQLLADTRSLLGFLYVLFGNDLLQVEVKHPRLLPASPVA